MNVLLWIELLLAALLWTAFSIAVAGRKNRAVSWVIQVVWGFIAPMAVLGSVAGASVALKFAGHTGVNWLGYTGSLLIAWAVGAVAITVQGMRRGLRQWRPAENWPRAGLAVATALTLVVAGITLLRIDLAVMSRASAIRSRAGHVLLALVPPENPDAQNAAPLYTRALAQLHADRELERARNDYEPGEPAPSGTRALLASRAGIVALLRQASAMPYCRFDYDYAHGGITLSMPELEPAYRAQWLMQLAVSDELSRGDASAALADVGVMFRMSRQIPQAPMATDALVRAEMEKEANQSLEKALPSATSARQLDTLDLPTGDFIDVVLPNTIAGERALGEETISGLIAQSADRRQAGKDRFYFPPPIGSLLRMYLLSDLDSYSAYMAEVGRVADRPWYAVDHARRRPPTAVPLGILADLLRLSALGKYAEEMTIAQARHEAARTAMAIERYRLDRGRLPGRLADLVPTYLAAGPVDPFTGKPMILAKRPGRWIIYSVGPDGKDDGGAEYNRRTQSGDVGFTLRFAEAQPVTRP